MRNEPWAATESGAASRYQVAPLNADTGGRPPLRGGWHGYGIRMPQVGRYGAGLPRMPVRVLEDHPHRDAHPQPEEQHHERNVDPQEFASHFSPPSGIDNSRWISPSPETGL